VASGIIPSISGQAGHVWSGWAVDAVKSGDRLEMIWSAISEVMLGMLRSTTREAWLMLIRPGIDVPETVVSKDDGPRPGTTLEALAGLKPVFKEGGTVTAGNACPLNDGAAALLIMSDEKARAEGFTPRARIIASTVAAIRPEVMGVGPIPAIQQLLKNTGMTIDDIDVVEINEAFAAQIVPCKDELGIPDEKLNPFGGAIALGHPFGMTGARIMTTLLNDLETLDQTYGIESMCVAGGMGMAMLVERL